MLSDRSKQLSLQSPSFKASAKYFTPSSVIFLVFRQILLFSKRLKLFSLQFLSFKASAKYFTPLSVISFFERLKLFSLQLVSFKASARYFTPSSVILLSNRFKILIGFQLLSWSITLLEQNSLICLHPRDPMLFQRRSIIKIPFCILRKLISAVQSTGPSWQSSNTTALKAISLTLFRTAESSASISYKQWHNVNAKFLSFHFGQQVVITPLSSSHSSLYVDIGRRFVKISVSGSSRSLRSPATNCNTTCHAPSLMRLETNPRNSASSMLSAKCFAAKNSWMVRCWKQYWALGFSNGRFASGFKSGNRWSRPQSSRFVTSSDSKVNLPSLIPLKATLPSFLKSPFTSSGSLSKGVKISSRPTVLLRYLLLCLKKKSFTAKLYISVSLVGNPTKASAELEVNWIFRMYSRHEQMMKQLTGI